MPTFRFAPIALSALLLAASAPVIAAQSRVPGWRYTMNISTDSGDAKRSSMAMRYLATGRSMRMEWVQVSGVSSPAGDASSIEGMYTILNDADSTTTMVVPAQRMATVMSLKGMGFEAAMPMKITPHITRTASEDLGPGERILGHATHHYRVTTAGTLDITTRDGQTCSQPIDGVTETWVAPDVDLIPAMNSVLGHYGVSGALDVTHLAADATSKPSRGTALRTVTKETSVDGRGAPRTVTTTMEYVEISQAPIDPAVFQVPADYQVMDMRQMMSMIPAGIMDSVSKATQASTTKSMCRGSGKP